ncbi:hypothetical protein VIN7_7816 [Saccharomyces cerevisiae x Saccharomyces kudriavzevii VIN7]|uniref:Uncharacterized protein n=1 Tax=Saccharomyces cerevisiae x Saccharomyces kudriavzevii (strain VIN7) TaxID=1095631 RepID=H0GWF2_SACCK|nr:hypothetical protein VIN7_7816 [Saccharomyces cerevisiae x Saccharomyces kudriavzevii VIN7]
MGLCLGTVGFSTNVDGSLLAFAFPASVPGDGESSTVFVLEGLSGIFGMLSDDIVQAVRIYFTHRWITIQDSPLQRLLSLIKLFKLSPFPCFAHWQNKAHPFLCASRRKEWVKIGECVVGYKRFYSVECIIYHQSVKPFRMG